MTLIQLEYLLSVAKHKNFTLAAEHSFVTQPTLSMQVQKFEKELGVEIFDRRTHPITITKIGERIISQAETLLKESKKLQQVVQEEKGIMEGVFRIGIIPTVIPSLIPLFLKTFYKNHPTAKLKIIEQQTTDIIENLKNGKLDFGVMATPIADDDIEESILYYEPMVAYVPVGHRLYGKKTLNETDLNLSDTILLKEGHCFRNNVLSICKADTSEHLPFELESGSFMALLKLVKEGFGMTLLPGLFVEDLSAEDQKNIIRFAKPEPTRQISLVYHKSQLRMSFSKELTKLIRSILRGKIYLESQNITSPLVKLAP